MRVGELMSILKEMDTEAEVVIVYQPTWPLESSLGGVATRAEIEDLDEEATDDDETRTPRNKHADGSRDDVVLVQGGHLRYGDRSAWEAARRR